MSQLQHLDTDEKTDVERLLVQDFGVKKPFSNLEVLADAVRRRNDIENEYVENPLKHPTKGSASAEPTF